MFNKRLLEFRSNGDLERLRRYWMTGTCRPGKQEHKSSDPLALEQFLSAFLLLMAGILLAGECFIIIFLTVFSIFQIFNSPTSASRTHVLQVL